MIISSLYESTLPRAPVKLGGVRNGLWAEGGNRRSLHSANSVPQGRLNLAQDASPGLDLKGRSVPKGRLKIGRDAILDNFQPSLRDLIMFHDVPRTSVLG